MAQISIIDLGTIPNDGTGDVLRFGGQIINDNFAELNLKKLEAGTFVGSASDLDARISNIEIDYATLSTNQTLTGIKTFNVLPVSNVTPTGPFQLTNKDYVDNAIANINGYDFWNLKTNGIQRTTVQSQGDLDLTEGDGIKLSYSAGGVVEIAFINDNLGFITDAPADGSLYARIDNTWQTISLDAQDLQTTLDTGNTSTTGAQFLDGAKLQLTSDSVFTTQDPTSDNTIEVVKINGDNTRFSGISVSSTLNNETTESIRVFGTRSLAKLDTISDENFAYGAFNFAENLNTGIPRRLIGTQSDITYTPPATTSTYKVNLIGGFNSFIQIEDSSLNLPELERQEIDDVIGSFIYIWNKSPDIELQDITGFWSVIRTDTGDQRAAFGFVSQIFNFGGSKFTEGGAFYSASNDFFDVSYAQSNTNWYVFRSDIDVQSVFSGTIQAKSFLISSDDNDPFVGGNGFYATLNAGTLTNLRNYTFQDADGIIAFLSDTLSDAPADGSQYARQNNTWTIIQESQRVINSTNTIEATLNNGEYELNAIGVANYKEWAQYFGTRSGGNLNVQIGDYDAFNNNTYIDIVDSTGFIDLNATQGKVNLNAPLITALGNLEMFFTDLQFRGSGTTTITKTGSATNTLTLPTSSGTFALTSQLLGDAPADSQQYARQNGAWTVINIPPSGSPEGYFIDGIGSYNNQTISIGDGDFTFNTAIVTIGSAVDLYAPNSYVSINTQPAGASARLNANSLSQDRAQALPDKDGTFAMLSDIVAGIGEAPNDGKQYARQNESWQQVVAGGYQFITENLDINNDFFITIGDFNTSGIEVQNQSGFNYIQLGNFNFDARVDISTTDVRIGDQFGLGTGTLFQMFSSSISINVQSGLRLESGFNTQGVNLKLNAIAANNKYDCFFPQKTGNQTIAMVSDLDAVGAQSKSFTITDPINEVIPLFVLGDSISITNIVVSRLGASDLVYKLGYGNTLDAIDQDIGSTETVSSNGANVISIIEGVPANNFLFLDIIDNGVASQFHITINYE